MATYSATVLADTPLAYYRLGETSGAAADSSGNNRPGTFVGSPVRGVTGPLRYDADLACAMNALGNITVANFPIPLDDISIEFWLNINVNQQNYAFGWNADDVTNRCSAHIPWSDGTLYWDYGNVNTGGARITLAYAPYLGAWHHIVLTASRTATPRMNIYIDGVLRSSGSPTNVGLTNIANTPLGIGSSGVSGLRINGSMDEFAIYNYVLTAAKVAAHYDAGVNQPFTGTVYSSSLATPGLTRGAVPAIPSADVPLTYPTKQISGHVYNTGTDVPIPVEGATVLLIRQSDGITVAQQFSGPGGVYLFVRNGEDVNQYFVAAFSIAGGTTQVHGTSNRGLVAT